MTLNELKLKIHAYINAGQSVELVSPPGRGKSTFVTELIDELSARDGEEWGLATMFIATQTPPDLIGYQFKGERTWDGQTYAVTDPTMPAWMITRSGKPVFAYKRGVLLLDEYGQGQTDVKAASAELFLNKQIGPWRLPEGWSVIACSNRQGDRSAVTKSLDFVINRRGEIHLTDDLASLTDWMWKHGVHPDYISFAETNPGVVFAEADPKVQGPWMTPRSLVMCGNLLDQMRTDGYVNVEDKAVIEMAAGWVGPAAAAQLMAHLKLGLEMPKYEDIVNAPERVKVPTKPDGQMLVTYHLAAKAVEHELTPVVTYMKRLPSEFGSTFAKALIKRNPTLVLHRAIEKWSDENATVMTAISQM